MANGPNLFARLHKWAVRQDENFMTESLAVILETMLEQEPNVGIRLVSALTGGFITVDEEGAQTLEIRTQVSTTEGRPDLEIRLPDWLAVVEVKVESPLRRGQLEGYREYLRTSGIPLPQTSLVLLTQYPPNLSSGEEHPDRMIRWYEVADAFEQELTEAKVSDPVCCYLCEQFLAFLKERNMGLAQVGWQLPEGTRALRNFLVMLQEAAKACQVSATKSLSLDDVGFKLDGAKYWVGLDLEKPQQLWFGTRCRIDREAAERLGVGEVTEENWVPGHARWWRTADLGSEEIHFYARSKVGQIQWLEEFLRDCLAKARSIETPDQPPIPDEPEGD
ncbi:MAG TPA: hypothetical protein VJ739_07100 [Gemmataceae bacterium]|nr:hypothetical protein [Gemmataceae bacterium]